MADFDWGDLFNTVVGAVTGGGGSSGSTSGGSSGGIDLNQLIELLRGLGAGGASYEAADKLAESQTAAFDALREGATRPVTSTGPQGTSGTFENGNLTTSVGDQLGSLQSLFNNVSSNALTGAQSSQATGGLTTEQKALQDLFTQISSGAASSLATGNTASSASDKALELLRQQSAEGEARQVAQNTAKQFATGQLGTSGGALQTQALAKGLAEADTSRQLAALQEGRDAGNYELGIATGANANQSSLATQGQQSISSQLSQALSALGGSTAISDEARKDMELAISANQSSNAALGQLASASTNSNYNPGGDLDAIASLLTGGGTNTTTGDSGSSLLDTLKDLYDQYTSGSDTGLSDENATEADNAASDTSDVNASNEADLQSIIDAIGEAIGVSEGSAAIPTTPEGTATITEGADNVTSSQQANTGNTASTGGSTAADLAGTVAGAGAAAAGAAAAGAGAGTVAITEGAAAIEALLASEAAAAAGGTAAATGGAAAAGSTAASGTVAPVATGAGATAATVAGGLALWGVSVAAIQAISDKYDSTKVGPVTVTDTMGNVPPNATLARTEEDGTKVYEQVVEYNRGTSLNPEIGTFTITTKIPPVDPQVYSRIEAAGVDPSTLSENDLRMLAHQLNPGVPNGEQAFADYLAYVQNKDDVSGLEGIDLSGAGDLLGGIAITG